MVKVIEIDSDEQATLFDEEIAKKPSLVKFYASWCGHCKALKPEWEMLERHLSSSNCEGDINIIAVNSDVIPKIRSDIPSKYVAGYPTILAIENGGEKVTEYDGARKFNDIKSFALKQFSNNLREINTKNKLMTGGAFRKRKTRKSLRHKKSKKSLKLKKRQRKSRRHRKSKRE